jgi:tetratricopeptide (TPR) repeat protein
MKTRFAGLVAVLILAGGVARAQDVAQGLALYNEGRYAEAEPVFRAAAATDPEARAWLAATLVRLGRQAEAETEAKAVLEANPVNPVAVKALGEALVMQDKLDEAVARMSAALAAKNDLAYAYYWRGQAYQRQKQVARMVDDYQAFLRLEPEAPESPALKVLLASLR